MTEVYRIDNYGNWSLALGFLELLNEGVASSDKDKRVF